jgi:hypothetical protein
MRNTCRHVRHAFDLVYEDSPTAAEVDGLWTKIDN